MRCNKLHQYPRNCTIIKHYIKHTNSVSYSTKTSISNKTKYINKWIKENYSQIVIWKTFRSHLDWLAETVTVLGTMTLNQQSAQTAHRCYVVTTWLKCKSSQLKLWPYTTFAWHLAEMDFTDIPCEQELGPFKLRYAPRNLLLCMNYKSALKSEPCFMSYFLIWCGGLWCQWQVGRLWQFHSNAFFHLQYHPKHLRNCSY